jgi:Putative transposase
MIVPGGGFSLDGGKWVSCRPRFLLPVPVLSQLFRRPFLDRLQAIVPPGELGRPDRLASSVSTSSGASQSKLDLVRGQGDALDKALDKIAITVGGLPAGAVGSEVVAERGHDERLKLSITVGRGLRDAIAIAQAALVCVGRAHAVAARIKDAAG